MTNFHEETEFTTCTSLEYSMRLGQEVTPFEYVQLEEIEVLMGLGFSVVCRDGRMSIVGTITEYAKLIEAELKFYAEYYDGEEFVDYMDYHFKFVDDVRIELETEVIPAVKKEQDTNNPRYLDIFEYIENNWKLSDFQKKELERDRREL